MGSKEKKVSLAQDVSPENHHLNQSFDDRRNLSYQKISSKQNGFEYDYNNPHLNYPGFGSNYEQNSYNLNQTQALPGLMQNPYFKPRRWKMGLRDKLDSKEKYSKNVVKREEKI